MHGCICIRACVCVYFDGLKHVCLRLSYSVYFLDEFSRRFPIDVFKQFGDLIFQSLEILFSSHCYSQQSVDNKSSHGLENWHAEGIFTKILYVRLTNSVGLCHN